MQRILGKAYQVSSSTTKPNDSIFRKTQLKFDRDIIAVVETNVDDVTGEIVGRVIDRLISEGAYDATASSYLGKKGRMGQTLHVLCSTDSVEKYAQILVEETGTLGVKIMEYTRLIVPRRTVSVPFELENYKGNVNVKVAEIKGRIRIKPEITEAKQIADSQKVPLRDVLEAITTASKRFLESQKSV